MEKRRQKTKSASRSPNKKRSRPSFLDNADRLRQEHLNYHSGRRVGKSMAAAIGASAPVTDEDDEVEFWKRMLRWSAAILLLPFCWVTAWTFLARFSHMTLEQGFWHSEEFWYFAIGMLLMGGWFASGLLKSFFLLLYVLGHELTHVVFVVLCRGRVTDFHVSTEGGYITTNKTNLLIALSPYFVPWWSVITVCVFILVRFIFKTPETWNLAFYGLMGLTWTFHFVWTVWMIPRDQPDLRENGTFLSLVIIFLGNLVVLVALLCLAERSPWESFKDFGHEWLTNAATWADVGFRAAYGIWTDLRAYSKL